MNGRHDLYMVLLLTFLFTGRDAAITMNIQCTLGVAFKQIAYHAVVVLADRTPACSNVCMYMSQQ